MRINYESKITTNEPNAEINSQQRDQITSDFLSLRLKTRKNTPNLNKVVNNNMFLSAEDHVFGLEKDGTRIDGIPGTTNSIDPLNLSVSVTTIYGVEFIGAINISANASVTFNNCRFNKGIAIEAGGKAHFNSCYYKNTGVINNAGIAANVYVIGCINKTGLVHTNATIIAETT